MPLTHKQYREGDEIVCSCGMRWGIDEDDPHEVEPSSPEQILHQLKMNLNGE